MASEVLKSAEIRGDLDPSQLVFRQMDRCNQLMTDIDPWVFEQSVYGLMDNLHPRKLLEVINRSKDYTDKGEEWEYDYYAGTQIGTPEKPVNGSPRLVPYERVNPRKLCRGECFDSCKGFY